MEGSKSELFSTSWGVAYSGAGHWGYYVWQLCEYGEILTWELSGYSYDSYYLTSLREG